MISVCIDMMFQYCDFYSRIARAKNLGFDAVEFWKWNDKNAEKISTSGMPVSVFNLDSRDEKLSYELSRGILNDGKSQQFLYAIKESAPVYKKLNAKAMIVLIGENSPFNRDNVYNCLKNAAPLLEKENINLVVEPLNCTDRPGYAMPYAGPVFEILKDVASPRIKLLYDIYHQNMTGDFSMDEIGKHIDLIGHFHVADMPGRHEPGTGVIDYTEILKKIKAMPYNGYIGLEYRATRRDEETFDFIKEI